MIKRLSNLDVQVAFLPLLFKLLILNYKISSTNFLDSPLILGIDYKNDKWVISVGFRLNSKSNTNLSIVGLSYLTMVVNLTNSTGLILVDLVSLVSPTSCTKE